MPSWAGGRQESGLANVIYQLAYHMSQYDNVDMTLAATDFFQFESKHERLRVLGWTRGLLVRHIAKHPFAALRILFLDLQYLIKYHGVTSSVGTYLKLVYLHYALCRIKPDVVHLHGIFAAWYYKVVPKEIKIIVTMHGICGTDTNLDYYKSKARMENDICHNSRVSHIVFIAEGVRDAFIKQYGEIRVPTSVVINAYDAKSFYYIEHKPSKYLTLITVASLSQLKGQMRVLEGIARSKKKFIYNCVGAGTTDMINQLKGYASVHGIDFTYFGKKNPTDIRDLLSYADYMIMPSSSEGFGLSFLESMACGVPVILPKDLPIVKEKGIIQPGINSILLDDCSSESISKCLDEIYERKFDRNEVSNTMLNYSWENIAIEYLDIIKGL